MSDLKQRALALYKPPFHRVHGYIFDADHRMVADDAAAKNEDAALRVRGWGRIQYLEDAEALQDAAGDMIAEALTEYWQRRTQPEATKPAQDLQLVVATSTDTGFFHVVINVNDGKRSLILYDKQHSLNGDTVGVADIPAAALASPADALVAGDRVDAQKVARYDYLASKGFDIEFISGEDGHTTIATSYCYSGPKEKFSEWVGKQIDAAIQAQKDGHG